MNTKNMKRTDVNTVITGSNVGAKVKSSFTSAPDRGVSGGSVRAEEDTTEGKNNPRTSSFVSAATTTANKSNQGTTTATTRVVETLTAAAGKSNVIKLKSSVPLKAGSKGNIILHGPNNKILSLQIKSPSTKGAVSFIPLNVAGSSIKESQKAILVEDKSTRLLKSSGNSGLQAITSPTKLPILSKLPLIPGFTVIKSGQLSDANLKISTCTSKSSSLPSSSITTTTPTVKGNLDELSIIKSDFISSTTGNKDASSIAASICKSLDAKQISLTRTSKRISPAQAATVPNSSSLLIGSVTVSSTESETVSAITTNNMKISDLAEDTLSPVQGNERQNFSNITIIKPNIIIPKESFQRIPAGTSVIRTAAQVANGKPLEAPLITKIVGNLSKSDKESKLLSSKLVNTTEVTTSPTLIMEEEKVERTINSNEISKISKLHNSDTILVKSKPCRQESLLRNKTIEKLKSSPRTKARSKSLSLNAKKDRKSPPRRLSTSSENNVKRGKLTENILQILKDNISPTKTTTTNSLLCDEKLEVSPDSSKKSESSDDLRSATSDSVSSPGITSNTSNNFKPKKSPAQPNFNDISSQKKSVSTLNSNDENTIDDNEVNIKVINVVSSEDEMSEIVPEKAEHTILEPEVILASDSPMQYEKKPSLLQKTKNLNPSTLLNWTDGVGSIQECKLNFKLNEFGLIEIVESNQTSSKVGNTPPNSNTLFLCKICNYHGTVSEFFLPDVCSLKCLTIHRKKENDTGCNNNDSNNDKPQKKYGASRRKMSQIVSKPFMDDFSLSKQPFSWPFYLEMCKQIPAPVNMFLNPFPCGPNLFKVGMKLEAIDPERNSLFCVCTIIEKKGYRLKLHFDGYAKKYDFWVNADSMDIFPPGWCAKTNRILQPPLGMNHLTFNWPAYLTKTTSIPAPRNLFTHLNSSNTSNPFKVGMKLEADDLRNTRKVCVATVSDVLDNRILIHFDGWDDSYDYWIDISSPFIHPVNWHKTNNCSLVTPPDWEGRFSWQVYLVLTKSIPASKEMFSAREPMGFKVSMKLEVVDKKNSSLIRPATIIEIEDFEIKVLFDRWPSEYAFWIVDDSPDIHPVGWCEITGHELEPPPGFESLPVKLPCTSFGCRGIGNFKRRDVDFHANTDSCPYFLPNWTAEVDRSQRIEESKLTDIGQNSTLSIMPGANYGIKRKASDDDDDDETRRSFGGELISKLSKFEKESQLLEQISSTLLEKTAEKPNTTTVKDTEMSIYHKLLCDYGPRLNEAYQLLQDNFKVLTKNLNEPISKNPLEWTVNEVASFVGKLPRCQQFSEEFIKEEIDGFAFLSLHQTDLTDIMKLKIGPATKIYHSIISLRAYVANTYKNGIQMVPIPIQELG